MDHVFSEDGLGGRIGRTTSCKELPPDNGDNRNVYEKGLPTPSTRVSRKSRHARGKAERRDAAPLPTQLTFSLPQVASRIKLFFFFGKRFILSNSYRNN